MWVSYYNGDTSSDANFNVINVRHVDYNNRIRIAFKPSEAIIQEADGGVYTRLETNTAADTDEDTWYDLRIVADGANVTVWRAERGEQMEIILDVSNASVTSTNLLHMEAQAGTDIRYDNIRILSDTMSNTTTYVHNSANEMTSLTDVNGQADFTYDELGRTATKTRDSFTATYKYHYGDKLASVISNFPDEDDVTYEYGGNGLRRERTTGGVTTTYNWSGLSVASEEDSSGDLIRTYVGGAHLDGTTPSTGTYSYYAVDHLGSTRAIFDQSKNQIGAFNYTPYGNPLLATITGLTTHRFTGHDLDAQTGLYFAPFRHYNPKAARWTTRDPLGMVEGPNIYAYVLGNPIIYVDPSGLSPTILGGCGAGAVGGMAFKAAGNIAGNKPIGCGLVGAAVGGCVGGATGTGIFKWFAKVRREAKRSKALDRALRRLEGDQNMSRADNALEALDDPAKLAKEALITKAASKATGAASGAVGSN